MYKSWEDRAKELTEKLLRDTGQKPQYHCISTYCSNCGEVNNNVQVDTDDSYNFVCEFCGTVHKIILT